MLQKKSATLDMSLLSDPLTTQFDHDCWVCSFWPQASLQWFDPTVPAWQAVPVSGSGRGSAWFMTLNNEPVVLRQYRRGGMIARISQDLYVWQGLQRSRSFRELLLLADLTAKGLRVAKPVAALVCRSGGLFYRAALLTERIAQARALWQVTDHDVWQRAGVAIAQLHQQGVWHADLNANNILVDALGQVWLIDFDRARVHIRDKHQLQGNLQRLERSVLKICPEMHPSFWPVLLRSYDQACE